MLNINRNLSNYAWLVFYAGLYMNPYLVYVILLLSGFALSGLIFFVVVIDCSMGFFFICLSNKIIVVLYYTRIYVLK